MLLTILRKPLADQLLVLDQGDVGLDAGRIAIHHEGDRAGGSEDGGLRVAVAVGLAQLERSSQMSRAARRRSRRDRASRDGVGGVAMLLDDAQERPSFFLYSSNGPPWSRATTALLAVGLGRHERSDGGGVGRPSANRRRAAAHQQRAQVGVAQAERPEQVRVLGDPRRRVAALSTRISCAVIVSRLA